MKSEEPDPAQHPAGRLGADGYLQPARAGRRQPRPAERRGARRDLQRDHHDVERSARSRRSTRACTLPALKIVPLHRSDRSGDTFLFTSYLSTQDQQWDDVDRVRHDGGLAEGRRRRCREDGSLNIVHGCASTPGCVAYNGISYLSQALAAGLGEAALANSAGSFTLPTGSAIQRLSGQLRVAHPAQRDDLDDRRPVGRRVPDRQLRVRRRQHPAARCRRRPARSGPS